MGRTPLRFEDKRENDYVNLTKLHDEEIVFTLSEIAFDTDARTGDAQLRAEVHEYTTGERIGKLWTTGVIVVDQMRAFMASTGDPWDAVVGPLTVGPLTVGKGERAYFLSDAS